MWTPQRREVIALVAMLDLASHATASVPAAAPARRGAAPAQGAWVKTQAIAARHGIPLAFLEQIVHRLCQADLIHSRRGPSGGLRLGRPAAEIRAADVLRAVATREAPDIATTPGSVEALVEQRLAEAGRALLQTLETWTLERLADEAERLGLTSRPKSALSFDI